jgi:hypothetical protein
MSNAENTQLQRQFTYYPYVGVLRVMYGRMVQKSIGKFCILFCAILCNTDGIRFLRKSNNQLNTNQAGENKMIIFLHGHGSWAPTMGYVNVPKKSSISFYTHFAKLLNQTMVAKIFRGTHVGEMDRTIGAYHTVPNLRMSSLTVGQKTWAEDEWDASPARAGNGLWMLAPAPPTQRISLGAIMTGLRASVDRDIGDSTEVEFRWLCCQALGLKQVGGREHGLNASDRTAQAGHMGEYLFKWTDSNGVAQQKFVKSNSSIHQ